MGDEEPPEWMGTPAAAAYLGIRLRTLYKLINDGRLPPYKPARVFRCGKLPGRVLESHRVQPGTLDHLCGSDTRSGAVG